MRTPQQQKQIIFEINQRFWKKLTTPIQILNQRRLKEKDLSEKTHLKNLPSSTPSKPKM